MSIRPISASIELTDVVSRPSAAAEAVDEAAGAEAEAEVEAGGESRGRLWLLGIGSGSGPPALTDPVASSSSLSVRSMQTGDAASAADVTGADLKGAGAKAGGW